MANSDAARNRRRAQRQTAKAVREARTQLPRSFVAPTMKARHAYADAVISGKEPTPAPGSREAKNLGSMASKARWGKDDARYERAFSKFWYHKNDEKTSADIEAESDGPEDDNDSEDSEV